MQLQGVGLGHYAVTECWIRIRSACSYKVLNKASMQSQSVGSGQHAVNHKCDTRHQGFWIANVTLDTWGSGSQMSGPRTARAMSKLEAPGASVDELVTCHVHGRAQVAHIQ